MEHIFRISVEDVQLLAKQKLGRELSVEELEQVQTGVEFGLECWEEVVLTAIEEAVQLEARRRLEQSQRNS